MVETMLIDLKSLLVEREDCDAGTVQRLRDGLAQGKTQFRTLRDVNETLKKRLDVAAGVQAKKLHLKLGIANYFLGHLAVAIENLRQAEWALAAFYLGKSQREEDALTSWIDAELIEFLNLQNFRDREIVVYDSDPNELASSRVAAELIRQGYRAMALKGGIVDWLAANLPTETKEAPKQAPPDPGALKG